MKRIPIFEHRVGSHSDDYGGDADRRCEWQASFQVEGKLTQQAYDLIVPKYRKVTIGISPEAMEEFRKEKPNSPIEININEYTLIGNIRRRDYKHNRLHILAEVKND